jgi:hypothetical protein
VTNLQKDRHDASIRTPSTSASTAWYGKNDEHALVAIARGDLTVNPDTGHVDYRGKPAGHATRAGYIVISVRRYASRGWIDIGAHRIMWMALIAPIPAGMVVNHRNLRRWDNRLENLELVTQPDNTRHAHQLPYAAVGDQDDNCVSAEWFAQVRALAERDDATTEDIRALTPECERMPDLFAGGARQWRHPIGRRGEMRRAS